MSSSNLVQLVAVEETAYGKAPDLSVAVAHVIPFTSESLTGTPQTAASATIRSDRQGTGQALVGLESGGEISVELAAQAVLAKFMGMAMMSDAPTAPETVEADFTLVLDAGVAGDQLGRLSLTSGTFPALFSRPVEVTDVLVLPDGPRIVARIISDTEVELLVPRYAPDEEGSFPQVDADLTLAGRHDIGKTVRSVRLGKSYLDVETSDAADGDAVHGQEYAGALVNALALNFAYGSIVTAGLTFVANGYEQRAPALHQRVEAEGGTVVLPEGAIPLNASVDVPVVFTMDGLGVLNPTNYCIESVALTLTNNLTPQTCIGKLAANRFILGQADVSFEAAIYNATPSYETFMPKKLTQQPVGFGLIAGSADGGFGFLIPAAQLNFPDPAASGANTSVFINAAGVAKAGPNNLSSLRIYHW
jgi:hypothetical protein